MDPETCWVVADSEDQARSKITTYAYGLRTPSTDAMQVEQMRWTALAICSVDETVTVPAGSILTKRGQRIPIPTTPSSENESQ
jgi:hypothetical protein